MRESLEKAYEDLRHQNGFSKDDLVQDLLATNHRLATENGLVTDTLCSVLALNLLDFVKTFTEFYGSTWMEILILAHSPSNEVGGPEHHLLRIRESIGLVMQGVTQGMLQAQIASRLCSGSLGLNFPSAEALLQGSSLVISPLSLVQHAAFQVVPVTIYGGG
jgi:hypothetical protein